MTAALARMDGVDAGYGGSKVLSGFSVTVHAGEAVTLLGRNGMGKTTALNTLFGLLPAREGRVFIKGRDMTGAAPHRIAALGLGYVPEGRQIFPRLTAEENLIATAARKPAGGWTLPAVYRLFPALAERRKNLGTQLSGGEQQMLAIGRALMTSPDLLVLDEATEGLAPLMRREIWTSLAALKREGMAMLIVDKDLNAMAQFADRHMVIEKGENVWCGSPAELASSRAAVESYLTV
jgi:branched-chain amino acid transport system ATP-binding protein